MNIKKPHLEILKVLEEKPLSYVEIFNKVSQKVENGFQVHKYLQELKKSGFVSEKKGRYEIKLKGKTEIILYRTFGKRKFMNEVQKVDF